MCKAGMHASMVASITGNIDEGAYSIVRNGGYVDDAAEGDFMYALFRKLA